MSPFILVASFSQITLYISCRHISRDFALLNSFIMKFTRILALMKLISLAASAPPVSDAVYTQVRITTKSSYSIRTLY
jgi:hypothetical protein